MRTSVPAMVATRKDQLFMMMFQSMLMIQPPEDTERARTWLCIGDCISFADRGVTFLQDTVKSADMMVPPMSPLPTLLLAVPALQEFVAWGSGPGLAATVACGLLFIL